MQAGKRDALKGKETAVPGSGFYCRLRERQGRLVVSLLQGPDDVGPGRGRDLRGADRRAGREE